MSAYTKPTTTLADLVDTKTGGKRKRPDTHVEGIPLGAIVAGAAASAPAQRAVRTPRRMAAAAPEPASPSPSCEDVEMSDSAYDADESDDDDDEDDDIQIIM
ncbi:uncharacterized protein LOC62_01G000791 [Vanrija pseudolonga]|uniref:Uncharacterized protein n=1 Tax=Vanrija pseudolonga TaxID=143232 RepID=A0AAF1BMW1_9TREE|nr:hypothetical protein LOC62_01G000791 [Vanrija pseudolonga]